MASGNNRLRHPITLHTGTVVPAFGKGKGLIVRQPKKRIRHGKSKQMYSKLAAYAAKRRRASSANTPQSRQDRPGRV